MVGNSDIWLRSRSVRVAGNSPRSQQSSCLPGEELRCQETPHYRAHKPNAREYIHGPCFMAPVRGIDLQQKPRADESRYQRYRDYPKEPPSKTVLCPWT